MRAGGAALGDKLYTGQQQESDDGLGLYDYGARFYSTTLGRFAAVDPVVGAAGDPQSWNPYTYVRNNPLSYTDPTGRCVPGVSCPGDGGSSDPGGGCDTACQWRAAAQAYHDAEAQAWHDSQTIANGGAGDCDTACQWSAAARAYQDAADRAAWNAFVVAAAAYDQRHADEVAAALWALSQGIAKAHSDDSYDKYLEDRDDGGGGQGSFWGAVGSVALDAASFAGQVIVDDGPIVAEGSLASGVLGAAPVVGVALLGGALAPCDSMGCTADVSKEIDVDGERIKVRSSIRERRKQSIATWGTSREEEVA